MLARKRRSFSSRWRRRAASGGRTFSRPCMATAERRAERRACEEAEGSRSRPEDGGQEGGRRGGDPGARARALVQQVGAAVSRRGRAGGGAGAGAAGRGGGAARAQAAEAVAPLPELGHRRGPAVQGPGVPAAGALPLGPFPERGHCGHQPLQRKCGCPSAKL